MLVLFIKKKRHSHIEIVYNHNFIIHSPSKALQKLGIEKDSHMFKHNDGDNEENNNNNNKAWKI